VRVLIPDDFGFLAIIFLALGFLLVYHKKWYDFAWLGFFLLVLIALGYGMGVNDINGGSATFNILNITTINVASLNANWIQANETNSSALSANTGYFYNSLWAGNYLNLPAVAATCGSTCIANAFVGFNGTSSLAINSINSNIITGANQFITGTINMQAGNLLIYSASGGLGSLTYTSGANRNSQLPSTGGTGVAILSCLSCTQSFTALQTLTAGLAFPASDKGIAFAGLTASVSNIVGVNVISFAQSTNVVKQWASSITYTNINSTMWIIYAEPQSAGATMSLCEKVITGAVLTCPGTGNLMFNIATPTIIPSNEVETIDVPESASINMIYTGTWTFNTFRT
jgi:hypothetical protein